LASDNSPFNTANTTWICSSTDTCRDGFCGLLTQPSFPTPQLNPLPESWIQCSGYCSNMCSSRLPGMPAWEAHDPTLSRPIAAPLERCAELLGVDLDAIQEAAAHLEPCLRVDGTKVWTLMRLERQLRPDAYGRVRGGYLARRRPRSTRTLRR
jgi:hypothetical protein